MVQRLIALRRDYPALLSRDLRLLDVAPEEVVLAYIRPDEKPSNSLLVVLNYGVQAGVSRSAMMPWG